MEIPIWATHSLSWEQGGYLFKVWIAEGQYQYAINRFGDLERYEHRWGVKEWIANVKGEKDFKIEPVSLENK